MIFDWLSREGGFILSWWVLITLAGAAALPLCMRLLNGLPDRGYTLARAVGMLLVGFVFWLLASLGFLRNTAGGIMLAWLIVLVIGLILYFRQGERINLRAWWRENRSAVIIAEILFFVLLLGWAVVRSHINELRTTEKPMDLMFLSSIMRSEVFPPNDGWMSGYSISYYYFGYVLSAMLSKMSSVPSTLGFNLTTAYLFALTGLTVFGVAYNLVRSRALYDPAGKHKKRTNQGDEDKADTEVITASVERSRAPALIAGLLAMMFVVLMGNFETALIEVPFQAKTASEGYLRFWNIQERDVYPERDEAAAAGIPADQPVTLRPGKTDPARWDYWWWFRASRVLTDFNLDGTMSKGAQPIDEFPQFSYLLADNHPHVNALPFAALALGLALNLLLAGRNPNRVDIVFYAVCIGALIFLNTWDGPIYLVALLGADALRRLSLRGRLIWNDWLGILIFGLAVGVLMVFFYLPFLISFRSQASGILPNLITPTLPQQYFIMFGPFLLILVPFLIVELRRGQGWINWKISFQIVGALIIGLIFIALMLILVGLQFPQLNDFVARFVQENGGMNQVWAGVLRRRLEGLPTLILLLAGVIFVVARLFPRSTGADDFVMETPNRAPLQSVLPYSPATGFALLLVGIGLTLSLVPEFFYLRDNFGTRINTIFKFYYQVWLVFGISSAYAVYTLLADVNLALPRIVPRIAFGILVFVVAALGMIYPVLGIHNRMFIETGRSAAENPPPLTLDGSGTFASADDLGAIQCLGRMPHGDDVVAEAIGGAYNPAFGRVAALTGVPIVLGWENHENQWRGATYPAVAGTRAQDIPRLYTDLRWDEVQGIVKRYSIDYIFYGTSERSTYGSAGEDKFRENLQPICENNGSVFYRVTTAALNAPAR